MAPKAEKSIAGTPNRTLCIARPAKYAPINPRPKPAQASTAPSRMTKVSTRLCVAPSAMRTATLAPVSHGLLSADGRLLVVLAPLDSWFWVPGILDTNTGRIMRLPTDQASHTRALSWTPDGQIAEVRESVRSTLWRFQPVGNR
jgi:hypothetical protein